MGQINFISKKLYTLSSNNNRQKWTIYIFTIFYCLITILHATEDISSNPDTQHLTHITKIDETSEIINQETGTENSLIDAIINITTTTTTTTTEKPSPTKSCFYAEEEFCSNKSIFNENFKEYEPYCRCRKYPYTPDSYYCCNITDTLQITSCYKGGWVNIHMRNVSMKNFNISLSILKAATSLAMTDGSIRQLNGEFFRHTQLKCLNVSNNNLTHIEKRAFANLNSFEMLDISHNNLSKIPNLGHMKSLTVNIRGNKRILCHSLLDTMEKGSITFQEADTTHCLLNTTYNWFNTTETLPIGQLERAKILNDECPKPENRSCKCDPEQMLFEEEGINPEQHLVFNARVDCSNLGLTKLPEKLPPNTIFLNVSNNNITSLDHKFHSHDYKNLLRFDADNNQISSMYELEGTPFIETFQKFFLRWNAIHNIPDYLLSNALDHNPKGRVLYLAGNKLKCDCNSANILKLWLLERQNNIPDYNLISCNNMPRKVVELTDKELCQSSHDWTDYIYYLIASEIFLLLALIMKVSYDYWKFKTSGYLPWPASKMPKLPCDWLCES